MPDKFALGTRDILDILQPKLAAKEKLTAKEKLAKDACLADIAEAIDAIKAPPPRMLRERQLAKVASKLDGAVAAINSLPLEWRFGSSNLIGELDRARQAFRKLAERSKRKKAGRNATVAYRQKLEAAHQGFVLMIRWAKHAPTLTGDDYSNVVATLFEIATGKQPGDVMTACRQIINDMKKRGYDARKFQQLRRFMSGTGTSL
jgi:hypothetical protein